MKLRIGDEYRSLLPPLSSEEREALRADIKAHGVRVPVDCDEAGVILDGMHRYEIAGDGTPYRVVEGLTASEKIAYTLRANLARRNLSPDQKRALQSRQRQLAASLRNEGKTQADIAALLGVTQQAVSLWLSDGSNTSACNTSETIRIDARTKIQPRGRLLVYERVKAGMPVAQVAADAGVSERQIRNVVKQEGARAERLAPRPIQTGEATGVFHGDFREVGKSIAAASVDLIVTDPPYDGESIPLYGDLAAFAARVLKPGGWCLSYHGTQRTDEVLRGMSEHLTFATLFAVIHCNRTTSHHHMHLKAGWKPVVAYYKPPLSAWWDYFSTVVNGGIVRSCVLADEKKAAYPAEGM